MTSCCEILSKLALMKKKTKFMKADPFQINCLYCLLQFKCKMYRQTVKENPKFERKTKVKMMKVTLTCPSPTVTLSRTT